LSKKVVNGANPSTANSYQNNNGTDLDYWPRQSVSSTALQLNRFDKEYQNVGMFYQLLTF